jgi:Uma2 family endonuclease
MILAMERPIPDRHRRYTVEEYFAICETADVKYEYRDGELIPHGGWERDDNGHILGMAGGTFEHGEIACNLIRELGNALKGCPCRVNNSDVRVRVSRSGRYVLPDVSVTCGQPVFDPPDRRLTLVNPQVIVEVLSPSTADDDRGEKFRDYIAIG